MGKSHRNGLSTEVWLNVLQYDHYIKEEEKDGKFCVTEAVCELKVPSELPRQNSAELCISKPETGERAAHISLSSVGK